ncbi:hypothetical protein HOY82DRAFT_672710 [Tuber indicum]|nr:hypothetical protein HOY82DRAFT_672710 [Tuber indicum]
MLLNAITSILVLSTTLVAAVPAPVAQSSSGCPSGKPFTGQAGCSTCSREGNIVCGRDEDAIADLRCTRFSTGLTWVPVANPGKCGVDSTSLRNSGCPSGKPFTGQAGCSTCSREGNIVCGRDEDAIADLRCTRFSTGLTWVPVANPGKCGVDSMNLKTRGEYSCPSGKPFTGQAGCSTCSKEGNIVCGRDEDAIADLKCTRFVWVPVKNPGKCGVDSSYLKPRGEYSCPSGKPFTGQAGCSTCSKEGNIVCGRDEDAIADLKCTRFSTGLVWVPVKNPGKCGVDSSYLKPRGEYSCPSGKPFTGQAGCSTCSKEGNIVCGRDEDAIADLKCTRFSTGLVWVPVKNPGKCGVDSAYLKARQEPGCPSGKPFTGQAGCSTCARVGNIVCGRDEDVIADLRCTRFSTGPVWVPVKNPGKCGVDSVPNSAPSTCLSGKPFTGQAGCSLCSVVNNIVCGRDEDRVTDLKCTAFGSSLTWIPVDDPTKCGV